MTFATARAVILARQSFGAGVGRVVSETSCALKTPAQIPRISKIFRIGSLSYAVIFPNFPSVPVPVLSEGQQPNRMLKNPVRAADKRR